MKSRLSIDPQFLNTPEPEPLCAPLTPMAVCLEVIKWAQEPGNHGGNPYRHQFVRMAYEVVFGEKL
jgi:hypothetical protein